MIGQGDINIFAQPPSSHPFRFLYDLRADIQKFRRHVAEQLHQAGGFLRIAQVVDLLHLTRGYKVARLLFEADPQAAQDNLASIRVNDTYKIVANDAADPVGLLPAQLRRGHSVSRKNA